MIYKGGQSATLVEEFNERRNYKQQALAPYRDKVIDTWYQYPNYGFLNEKHEPVIANAGEELQNLRNFGDYADASQKALPFVVKAFDDFRSVFIKRTEAPSFTIPSYLGNMSPTKSYEDYEAKYKEYIESVRIEMSSARTESKTHLLRSITSNAKVFPITQSGFSLSRHCPISTSGLAIELADISFDTDSIKGELLSTNGYGCFVADAYNTGFYIDKNNPWRLIANLSSPEMQKYILEYKKSTTVENIMDRYFRRKTQYEDMQSVFSFFLMFGSGYSLTSEELISYTIRIRMAEVGMPEDHYEKVNREAQDIFLVYGNNYGNDPFKGPASIIGKYCSQHLKQIYEKKAKINSFSDTTIKDLI